MIFVHAGKLSTDTAEHAFIAYGCDSDGQNELCNFHTVSSAPHMGYGRREPYGKGQTMDFACPYIFLSLPDGIASRFANISRTCPALR